MAAWFDTHCHFAPEKGNDALGIIDKAQEAGVAEMLIQGTSVEDAPYVLWLTEQRPISL